MPFLRAGDNAAMYPAVMTIAGYREADDRTVNEVFGWLFRMFTLSAGHMTDYRVDLGTALTMAGRSEFDRLLKLCVRAKLIEKVRHDGEQMLRLIEDPEFLHVRLKAEVEWERQQRLDASDPRLTIPVRARDGDACRYCGIVVYWRGRRSNRSGSLDHVTPGAPAVLDQFVVACQGCNSGLRDAAGSERAHLRPPPAVPFYSAHTAEWLTRNGHPVAASDDTLRPALADTAPLRPASADPAPTSDPAPPDPAHSDPAEAGPRAPSSDPVMDEAVRNAISLTKESHSVGSGLDGPGRVSLGTAQPPTRPKRSPRGRAARGRPRDGSWTK